MKKFLKTGLIFTIAAAFIVVTLAQFGLFSATKVTAVTAVYGLDINPSFEIAVNKQDKVVSITPINDDAKSITVDDLYGKDSVVVIETLLQRAQAAGFITTTDLVSGYVVVTSIPMSANDQAQSDDLQSKLDQAAKTNDMLSSLNVAIIKSDLVTLRAAENKKVPIGLYVINGMVKQADGTYLSAKDFFSNPTYRATFQTKYQINSAKLDHMKTLILASLDKLDLAGVDTTALRAKLATATDQNINDLLIEVRALKKDHHLSTPAENNAIAHGKPTTPGNPNK